MTPKERAYACAFPADAIITEQGLTIREYFAGLAMQGLLTRIPNRPNGETDLGILECNRIAKESVIMADKLLEKLNNQ
jgi:hypothetical protein